MRVAVAPPLFVQHHGDEDFLVDGKKRHARGRLRPRGVDACPRDANHFERGPIEAQRFADHVRGRAEASQPQAVSEDHDVLVLLDKPPAEQGLDAEDGEVARGDASAEKLLRLAVARPVVAGRAEQRHILEGGVLRFPVEEVPCGRARFAHASRVVGGVLP